MGQCDTPKELILPPAGDSARQLSEAPCRPSNCIFMSSRPKLAHSSGHYCPWPLPEEHEQTTPWP
jgi:hypothetical protein